MRQFTIFIITGLSGSGKSTAIDAFEDVGYYCVDNMPVALLPKFLDLPLHNNADISGFAFVMDLRERGFLKRSGEIFEGLRKKGYRFRILFLEADENILVQRFSQTRRHHPLSQNKGLLEGIRAEKDQLMPLKEEADIIINTSQLNVHELKSAVFDIIRDNREMVVMKITVLSFGFKNGIPADADLVVDVRFLNNPFFIPHLKDQDGRDKSVRDFVLDQQEARRFIELYSDLLDFLIPLYQREGKAYLTIAVGCTGGRHRSVAVSGAIFDHINTQDRRVELKHRDI